MKTVRRLLYGDIVASVSFVALAFLALFFFIDVVEGIDSAGRRGQTVGYALLAAVYEIPGHLYELLPIALLIGAIYALSRMAQSSEFTILRTGGLGPGRALALLAGLGLAFGALTFVVGDYAAPAAERMAVALKARISGGTRSASGAGAWIKERRNGPEGERNWSINIGGTGADGTLQGLRLFEFDDQGRMLTRIVARSARVGDDGRWTLADADVLHWPPPPADNAASGAAAAASGAQPEHEEAVQGEHLAELVWTSTLPRSVVAAAVLPADTMTTAELWRYSEHLTDQAQSAQTHEIRFWRKAIYPFACLVMVALALPFAYLHARSGGVSLKVFGGIMLGISFVLLNNLTGHMGQLRDWTPWVAAAAPGIVYLLLSLAAFWWLVRYR